MRATKQGSDMMKQKVNLNGSKFWHMVSADVRTVRRIVKHPEIQTTKIRR